MDNISNSENEYQDLPLFGSHLDFETYWADRTIEENVYQGHKLRLKKPIPSPILQYGRVREEFVCPLEYGSQMIYRNKCSKRRLRSLSSHRCTFYPAKNRNKFVKSQGLCGIRIAQLAIPSKRHFLETWKTKAHILPDYMVERLRKHVVSQTPVVHISDAINCFKRKYKRSKLQKRKSVNKVETNLERKQNITKLLKKCDVTAHSAYFGYKIARKLWVPIKTELNSDLLKIARTIWYDVDYLLRKSVKKRTDINTKSYKVFAEDVVKKITVWIALILEDAKEKMVEDELKDFQDEVGPAIDILYELLEYALDTCVHEPEVIIKTRYCTDEGIIHDSRQSEQDDNIIIEEERHSSNNYINEQLFEISSESYFKNEIDKLIRKSIESEKNVAGQLSPNHTYVDSAQITQTSQQFMGTENKIEQDEIQYGFDNQKENDDSQEQYTGRVDKNNADEHVESTSLLSK